jgi:hypothetical protein
VPEDDFGTGLFEAPRAPRTPDASEAPTEETPFPLAGGDLPAPPPADEPEAETGPAAPPSADDFGSGILD